MSRWTRLFSRRKRMMEDLDQDIRDFIERETQDNIDRGMSSEEAHYAALRKFGNVTRVKEETREVWSFVWLEQLWQDVRFGLRMLAKKPGFTAVAVLSLMLGIGANTAVFSLIDQILLWSIPGREPSRIVMLQGGRSGSYAFYCAYRDRNQVFSGVFASSYNLTSGIRPAGAPAVEVGHVQYVSGNYFQELGIGSSAGRVIVPSDDTVPGRSPVAVLSYGYWQRRFAADARVIGWKLAVNGYPLEIAGVAEKGFGGAFNGEQADVFVPLTMFPVTTPSALRVWNTSQMFWLNTLARLKDGISMQQAQAAMKVLWAQAVDAVNEAGVKAGGKPRKFREDQIKLVSGAATASAALRGNEMAQPLGALALATALVLLIACANVANLLLARAAERGREIAMRLAVGATRARLIRQLLTESLLLSLAGGSMGVAFASLGVSALAKLNVINPELHFHPSPLVLGLSTGITLLTGILFGLAPAFRATRMTLAESITLGGAGTQGVSRRRVSHALVAAQVALSLTLLAGSGLFIRTLQNLQHANIGFARQNIAVFDVDPTNFGYQGDRLRSFYDQLEDRARTTSGVQSAALSSMTPFGSWAFSSTFSAEGYEPKLGETSMAVVNSVTSGFFRTLGASLLLGRDFQPQDEPAVTPGESLLSAMSRASGGTNESRASASHVCIIDEQLSRHLFGGANPLGRHLSFEDKYSPAKALEIVGVVKDIHYSSIRNPDRVGTIYQPSWSDGPGIRWLEIRFTGNAAPVIGAVRAALRDMDPNVPVLRVRMMQEYLNDAMARERLIAFLSSLFAVLALGLAAVGLYGVMAYAVRRRTREVGIRMALGARRSDVIRMFLREALGSLLVGVAVGLAGTLAVTRLIANQLYGVAPGDGASIGIAIAAVFAASLAAVAIPARRAMKVDPMVALRYE